MGCHCSTIGPCPSFCHSFCPSFCHSFHHFPHPPPTPSSTPPSASPSPCHPTNSEPLDPLSPPHTHSHGPPSQPVSLYPLQEVAGAEFMFPFLSQTFLRLKNASVPTPLTLTLILKYFNIWPNLTASPGMTFIPSSPQPSSQRRDEGSGMWLRHRQMRFTAPPLPTP
jgi:hypothetical protein